MLWGVVIFLLMYARDGAWRWRSEWERENQKIMYTRRFFLFFFPLHVKREKMWKIENFAKGWGWGGGVWAAVAFSTCIYETFFFSTIAMVLLLSVCSIIILYYSRKSGEDDGMGWDGDGSALTKGTKFILIDSAATAAVVCGMENIRTFFLCAVAAHPIIRHTSS